MEADIATADRTFDLSLFVTRLSSHSTLSEGDRETILNLPTVKMSLNANAELAFAETETDFVFFVASGLCDTFRRTRDGKRQVSAIHIPGDMVNLYSVVVDAKAGGVHASCPTNLLCISRGALSVVARKHPAISNAFWRDCLVDAAVMMQWINNLGRRDAISKLAHVFCEMAVRRSQQCPPTMTYTLPIAQYRLSDAISITPVHLSRMLSDLRKQELLDFDDYVVTIHNWKLLARLAQFTPNYLLRRKADLEDCR
jgi:CRP-like cAMP-binding protein